MRLGVSIAWFSLISLGSAVVLSATVAATAAEPSTQERAEEAIQQLLDGSAPPPDWREYLRQNQKPRVAPTPDASDDDFIEYWSWEPPETVPDKATQQRLLEICEKRTGEFETLEALLSKDQVTAVRLKRLSDRLTAEHNQQAETNATQIREWLALKSDYFRDELVHWASGEVETISPLLRDQALARLIQVDPKAAEESLRRTSESSNLDHRAYALGALLTYFGTKSEKWQQSWIHSAQSLIDDPKASYEARTAVIRGVMATDWREKESWFLRLFGDRHLLTRSEWLDRSDSALGETVVAQPDKWLPRIIPLLHDRSEIVRANAGACLACFYDENTRRDVLMALLPWVGNPGWVQVKDDRRRQHVLASLVEVNVPEAIPYLRKAVLVDHNYELEAVAEALVHYNAREAAPALRKAAERESDSAHRAKVAEALLELNGFAPEEIARGMRDYALKAATFPEEDGDYETWNKISAVSHPLLLDLGHEAFRAEIKDDEVGKAVVAEIRRLGNSNRRASEILWQAIAAWSAESVYAAITERLRSGDLTADWVGALLESKSRLPEYLKQITGLRGLSAGVQIALTRDDSLIKNLLASDDTEAKRALLACGRAGRVNLPLAQVSELLRSPDTRLGYAALRYLQGNDTPEARAELRKNEAIRKDVSGTELNFSAYPMSEGDISPSEQRLRNSFAAHDPPREIFALLSEGNFGGDGQRMIFVYDNRTVLRHSDGNGRMRERDLPSDEFKKLHDWMTKNKVFDLPPYDEGTEDGIQLQFVHLTPTGGERVFMNNPPGGPIGAGAFQPGVKEPRPDPIVYSELTRRMMQIIDVPMKVAYGTLESLPGFRVIHSNEAGEVKALSYRDGKLLAGVFVYKYKPIEWHRVGPNGLEKDFQTNAPEGLHREFYPDYVDDDRGVDVHEGPLAGKRIWPGRRLKDDLDALWVSGVADSPELFVKGIFFRPVFCLAGEWMVVAKTFGTNMWNMPNGVVRINVASKRMSQVDLPPADNFEPVAWVEAHQQMLLYQQRDSEGWTAGPESPEFYLLDVVTGAHRKVEGEFRPFLDAAEQELQPTGKPNEFWAALHASIVNPRVDSTTIGRFDSYNFRFEPVVEFPGVEFDSSSVFVDEPVGVIYVNLNGDLLRVALPKS